MVNVDPAGIANAVRVGTGVHWTELPADLADFDAPMSLRLGAVTSPDARDPSGDARREPYDITPVPGEDAVLVTHRELPRGNFVRSRCSIPELRCQLLGDYADTPTPLGVVPAEAFGL